MNKSTVLNHCAAALVGIAFAAGSSLALAQKVNIGGNGINIDAGDGNSVKVNSVGVGAKSGGKPNSAASKSTTSTGGKCVNGVLAVKLDGVGNQKASNLICDQIIIELNGSGNMKIASVKAKQLSVSLNGVGDVQINAGTADSATYNLSGSGDIKSQPVVANTVKATLDGVGNIQLQAQQTLKALINGSGNVQYTGKPTVDSNINGVGEVKAL
jgi:hypothetical protein